MLQEEEAVHRLTERMKSVLGPFVLRRLKAEVASQLTAKQYHEEVVSMTGVQAELYQEAVQKLRDEVTATTKGHVFAERLFCVCAAHSCISLQNCHTFASLCHVTARYRA